MKKTENPDPAHCQVHPLEQKAKTVAMRFLHRMSPADLPAEPLLDTEASGIHPPALKAVFSEPVLHETTVLNDWVSYMFQEALGQRGCFQGVSVDHPRGTRSVKKEKPYIRIGIGEGIPSVDHSSFTVPESVSTVVVPSNDELTCPGPPCNNQHHGFHRFSVSCDTCSGIPLYM